MPAFRENVVDNRDAGRFELLVEGRTAFLTYNRTPTTFTLVHTEVPEELRGRGIGTALVEAALDAGRREHVQLIVKCPFARAYLDKHRR